MVKAGCEVEVAVRQVWVKQGHLLEQPVCAFCLCSVPQVPQDSSSRAAGLAWACHRALSCSGPQTNVARSPGIGAGAFFPRVGTCCPQNAEAYQVLCFLLDGGGSKMHYIIFGPGWSFLLTAWPLELRKGHHRRRPVTLGELYLLPSGGHVALEGLHYTGHFLLI